MNRIKNILFLFVAIIFLSACEEVVDLKLPEGRSQIVVDAFVSDENEVQTIKLTWSAGYFDNSPPKGVKDAEVKITGSDGSSYIFIEKEDGNYEYDASTLPAIDSIGTLYTFHFKHEGKEFISKSYLNPVPEIDKIGFYTELNHLTMESNTFAEFFATDIAGRTDYYWIKSFLNGESLTDQGEFNIVRDASSIGSNTDGLMFDLFVRRSINNYEMPIENGDEVRVELNSISESAWNFLNRVNTEASNGGLFSVPPSNIESNITGIAGEQQDEVLGVFTMMSKSSLEVTVTF